MGGRLIGVAETTASLPFNASSVEPHTSTSQDGRSAATRSRATPGLRLYTRTIRSPRHSAGNTRRWELPSAPNPSKASRSAPCGRNARSVSPVTTAVRTSVIQNASMTASGRPVSGSFSTYRLEHAGRPVDAGLPA